MTGAPDRTRARRDAVVRLYDVLPSPLGDVRLVGDGTALTAVTVTSHARPEDRHGEWRRDPGALRAARDQLAAYLAGELTRFDLPLAPAGTPFQHRVWAALQEIPYGRTWSYGQLAAHIGAPTAARAVGLANGRNPLWVVVPCHRVVGADGRLTGYAGGVDRKLWLLAHEARHRDVDRTVLF